MQPTLKRLVTSKREVPKKHSSTFDVFQKAAYQRTAQELEKQCKILSEANAAAYQVNSKFLTQIQVVFQANDSLAMFTQLKVAMSMRPTSNQTLPAEHPLKYAVLSLTELLFNGAPRVIVRELVRLLGFCLTPLGSSQIADDSLCAFARSCFLSQWAHCLKLLDTASSLSLATNTATINYMEEVNRASMLCDVVWALVLSPVPQLLSLFATYSAKMTVLCFLTRTTQLLSREEQEAENAFPETIVESLLGALHAFIKLVSNFREKLAKDYNAIITACGLDPAATITQLWTEETLEKISARTTAFIVDDYYRAAGDISSAVDHEHVNYVYVLGALYHGALGLLCSKSCSKDTTHSAGLFVSLLATEFLLAVGGTHYAAWIQNQLVVTFFPSLATSVALSAPSALNSLPVGSKHQSAEASPTATSTEAVFARFELNASLLASMPHPALLSILRGVIVCLSSEPSLLTSPCSGMHGILKKDGSKVDSRASSPSTGLPEPSTSEKIEPSSILFDAALPTFIKLSEASLERYARFLAVKSVGACVDFIIKALKVVLDSSHHEPAGGALAVVAVTPAVLSYLKSKVETAMEHLLDLIWKNWEDSFESIVSEVCAIFPQLLDVGELGHKLFAADSSPLLGPDFTDKLALHILSVDIATKGKYPLLTLLIQRIGPAHLLELRPTVLSELFAASSFTIASRAVGPVINVLLTSIHDIIKASQDKSVTQSKKNKKQVSEATAAPSAPLTTLSPIFSNPVELLCKPLLKSLLDEATLAPIGLYVLPHVFELFPACFKELVVRLTEDGETGQKLKEYSSLRVKALLSVLKVARSHGLIESEAFLSSRFFGIDSAETDGLFSKLIEEALVSADINIRLDTLQLIADTRKASDLPTAAELLSVVRNLDYNMLENSLVYRNRLLNLLDLILLRFKDAIKHHYKLPARFIAAQKDALIDSRNAITFLNEFSNSILHQLYTPAPPHRRYTALETLRSLVTKFGPDPAKGSNFVPYADLVFSNTGDADSIKHQLPISTTSDKWRQLEMFSPAAALSVLVGLWDQYDSGRVLSYEVLKSYPSPLPGFEKEASLVPFVRWAVSCMCSSRMREADSGSLALRLIVAHYMVKNTWALRLLLKPTGTKSSYAVHVEVDPESKLSKTERLVQFCHDLLDIVLVHVKETRESRQHASVHFPVHGPLMALRYMIAEVNLSGLAAGEAALWSTLLHSVISIAQSVSTLALELKYPLRYTHNAQGEVDQSKDHETGDEEGDEDDEALLPQEGLAPAPTEDKSAAPTETQEGHGVKKASLVNSTTEGVLVAMWLSLKEVSFLLGSLVQSVIAGARSDASREPPSTLHAPLPLKILSTKDIKLVGQHLLDNLLVLRHRGAMETSSEGFQVVCESILSTTDKALHLLVHEWLAQLLNRIDNTPWALLSTRRSAGLPYAFLAILRAEAKSSDRVRAGARLLPFVFPRLIATASRQVWEKQKTLVSIDEQAQDDEDSPFEQPQKFEATTDADVGPGHILNHSPKEHRHQVHALNVIRAIIRDRAIVGDISPYVESVLTLVLKLYLSPHWAVQNAATMSFSTLLERMAGGSKAANATNGREEEKAPSAAAFQAGAHTARVRVPKLNAADFFTRYPIAHAFLAATLARETGIDAKSQISLEKALSAFRLVSEKGLFPSRAQLLETLTLHSPAQETSVSSTEETASSSLYAVLLLLSRMSPSRTASAQQQANLAPFILLTCSAALNHANSMVRVLAAKAMAPLVTVGPEFCFFVQSLIDALPNAPKGIPQSMSGTTNHVHGLLVLILQLLRSHCQLMASAKEYADASSNDDISSGSYAATCAAALEQLRDEVLPSLQSKLWLLRTNAAIAVSLLCTLKEFVVQPLCDDSALIALHPKLSSFAALVATFVSIQLRKRAISPEQHSASVQAVMKDVFLHQQYKLSSAILVDALLHLSSHLDLSKALFSTGEIWSGFTPLQATVAALLEFPVYEVRLNTYKALAKNLNTPYLSREQLAKRLLQLIGFLPLDPAHPFLETYPKCQLRLVKLLNTFGDDGTLSALLAQTQEIDASKVFALLQRWAVYEPDAEPHGPPMSVFRAQSSTATPSACNTSLRQESLIFLGFFLRNLHDSFSDSAKLATYLPMLSWWLDMVERHSRYELATPDRTCAILSLSRHILMFSKKILDPQYEQLVIDYWMLLVRVLQDDLDEIREIARSVVSRIVLSDGSSVASSSGNRSQSQIRINIEPGLMSCTLFCYDLLTRNASNHPRYWQWLLTGLAPEIAYQSTLTSDAAANWKRTLGFSTQLFEQEKPNFFHEEALIAQISRHHLLILVNHIKDSSTEIKDAFHKLLEGHKTKIVSNFEIVAQLLIDRHPHTASADVSTLVAEWQLMYAHVFTPLYNLLIAIETHDRLSSAAGVHASRSDTTKKLIQALSNNKAGLPHPVMQGLLQTLAENAATERCPFTFASHGQTTPKQTTPSMASTSTHFATTSESWSQLAKIPHLNYVDFLLPHRDQS